MKTLSCLMVGLCCAMAAVAAENGSYGPTAVEIDQTRYVDLGPIAQNVFVDREGVHLLLKASLANYRVKNRDDVQSVLEYLNNKGLFYSIYVREVNEGPDNADLVMESENALEILRQDQESRLYRAELISESKVRRFHNSCKFTEVTNSDQDER